MAGEKTVSEEDKMGHFNTDEPSTASGYPANQLGVREEASVEA